MYVGRTPPHQEATHPTHSCENTTFVSHELLLMYLYWGGVLSLVLLSLSLMNAHVCLQCLQRVIKAHTRSLPKTQEPDESQFQTRLFQNTGMGGGLGGAGAEMGEGWSCCPRRPTYTRRSELGALSKLPFFVFVFDFVSVAPCTRGTFSDDFLSFLNNFDAPLGKHHLFIFQVCQRPRDNLSSISLKEQQSTHLNSDMKKMDVKLAFQDKSGQFVLQKHAGPCATAPIS